VIPGVAEAYTATGGAWETGPGRVYDRLSAVTVACSPVSWADAFVLDLGAGTGAATRAVLDAGASRVIAIDVATGMLAHDAANRPPAVVGDALALPFRAASFDAVVAAFSVNHLTEPAAGLAEARRVTRPGGAVVASSYAADDTHPVKEAVEVALAARGWEIDPSFARMKREAVPQLATEEGVAAAATAAGLDPEITPVRVPFPELDAEALVAWRLGMAHHAPFVAGLPPAERAAVVVEAVANLGADHPVLERSIIVATAVVD
jgi:SAM-dependent methyltransferase